MYFNPPIFTAMFWYLNQPGHKSCRFRNYTTVCKFIATKFQTSLSWNVTGIIVSVTFNLTLLK